jgi:hypothetical protein
MVISVVSIIFGAWYFLIPYIGNAQDTKYILPPDYYSVNGHQICPKKTNVAGEYKAV